MNANARLAAAATAFSAVFAFTASGAAEFNSNWSVKGKRVININTVVRVNQIEVSRDTNRGKDEAHLHTVEAVETFRKAVSDAIPEAKVTWSFSWRALQDQRPNYVAVRKRIVEYHRQYGDEITFIPGAYFAPMYNSRAQTNRDIHDGLKLVSEMVGGGYRPHGVVAGFLAADNLRYLAEEENIHVAQGTIWSQYGIDNGDGDGSISYPYYPSREHACKPAQGEADFIDCVNLDGWTCDFLCARKFGFEGGGNSRTGVGPIETYGRLGLKNGMKETRAVVRSHFGDNFKLNGFGWIVVNWEICLVKLNKPEYTAALTQWLKGVREEFPDTIVPLMSEFGEAWRRENPNNDRLDYRFVQRGNCIHRIFSEPNLEIRWYMNRKFRMATLRDWTKNEPEMVIDLTRYDLPAKEPPDASVKKPTRNWSLVNRINQKRRRPEDAPIPLSALTEEERRMVNEYYLPPEMRVMTYNVRYSAGDRKSKDNNWNARRDDFARMVERENPDVVGFQEVLPDQRKWLEKRFPDYAFIGEGRDADRIHGEASPVAFRRGRFEAVTNGTFWLSETPDVSGSKSWGTAIQRICTYAVLKDKSTGKTFSFANTHTDHKSEEAREKGMLLIIERMKEFGKGAPVVFVGDHNCLEYEKPAKAVSKLLTDAIYLSKTPPQGSWRTFNFWNWHEKELSIVEALKKPIDQRSIAGDKSDMKRIDYIYVSPGTTVLDYRTVPDTRPGTKLYPSDHFPSVATIEFK